MCVCVCRVSTVVSNLRAGTIEGRLQWQVSVLWDSGEVKRTVSVSSSVVERVATGMRLVGPTCDDE